MSIFLSTNGSEYRAVKVMANPKMPSQNEAHGVLLLALLVLLAAAFTALPPVAAHGGQMCE